MKIITKNKRGAGHVEAILSMVIFIGFIFALLYLIKPFETRGSNNNVDILRAAIPAHLKAELSQWGINVYEDFNSQGQPKGCFFILLELENNTQVLSSNGSFVQSVNRRSVNQNHLYIRGTSGLYTIYISDEFENNLSMDTAPCDLSTEYRLGLLSKVDAISYKKALEFNETYWSDYSRAKTLLRIPDSAEFGFIITDGIGGQIINSFKSPITSVNLNVKEVSTQMLYSNGTLQNVRIRIYSY